MSALAMMHSLKKTSPLRNQRTKELMSDAALESTDFGGKSGIFVLVS
jgi:hypothetical protein